MAAPKLRAHIFTPKDMSPIQSFMFNKTVDKLMAKHGLGKEQSFALVTDSDKVKSAYKNMRTIKREKIQL